jgi:UPF0716 protein FxsA
MQRALLILFIVIPALELWGIIEVGHRIGGWPTFLLLIASGFAGGWLLKVEGRRVWMQAQRLMQAGQVPGFAILDGLCVLAGGILLMVPGFLSDIVGITLLLPFTRPFYRVLMYRWLERRFRGKRIT